jgi:hypothetical protein
MMAKPQVSETTRFKFGELFLELAKMRNSALDSRRL